MEAEPHAAGLESGEVTARLLRLPSYGQNGERRGWRSEIVPGGKKSGATVKGGARGSVIRMEVRSCLLSPIRAGRAGRAKVTVAQAAQVREGVARAVVWVNRPEFASQGSWRNCPINFQKFMDFGDRSRSEIPQQSVLPIVCQGVPTVA